MVVLNGTTKVDEVSSKVVHKIYQLTPHNNQLMSLSVPHTNPEECPQTLACRTINIDEKLFWSFM